VTRTRAERSVQVAAVALLAAVLAGCGQRGPLALPEAAQPIERLPQPPAPSSDSESQEDERENER